MTIIELPTKYPGITKRGRDIGGGRLGPEAGVDFLYCARYRDANGDSRRLSFERQDEARDFKDETRRSVRLGAFIERTDRMLTVKAYSETWLERGGWAKNTRRGKRSAMKHIVAKFGGRYLGSLSSDDLQEFVDELVDNDYDPGTVATYFSTLRGMLQTALIGKKILSNPAVRGAVKLPPKSREVRRVLEDDQVAAIAAQMPPEYRLMVWLGAMAGLRVGEALGVVQAHLSDDQLKVWHQWTPEGDFACTKTAKANRVIPMSPELAGLIADHIGSFGMASNGMLFTRPGSDRPLSYSRFHAHYREAVKGLGLPEDLARFHALRHYYASVLINSRVVDIALISEYLGHSQISETYNTYTHFFKDADKAAKSVFAGRFVAPKLRAVS